MTEPELEILLTQYNKRVLKWRMRAVKAETDADTLRKQNVGLRRIIDENDYM